MSAIHAMSSSNSNSPTDPLRHNHKVNGITAQNSTKTNLVYSPLTACQLPMANNTNVNNNNNNNNNHIINNNSNADNSPGWCRLLFSLPCLFDSIIYSKNFIQK